MNSFNITTELPVSGWVVIALLAICALVAFAIAKIMKSHNEVNREIEALAEVCDKLDNAVCAINEQTRQTCEAMNKLSHAIAQSVNHKDQIERRNKK